MPDKKKVIDPIPDSFASEEEAGDFWDTHSLADYEESLEPADITFDIQERVFEIRVAEDVFQKLKDEAESSHQSVPNTVDRILRKELSLAR
jgi:hypothetical protein